MIKKWTLGLLMGSVLLATMPEDVLAKRLGGGGSSGMRRSVPTQPVQRDATPHQNTATPAQQPNQAQQGATAGAAAQAAQPRRNWMGPIAGLAAGLGLAALMSHLGMGEAFANMIMMALLAVAAVALIAFLMRRFGKGAQQRGAQPPFAYAGNTPSPAFEPRPEPAPAAHSFRTAAAANAGGHVPVAFDRELQSGAAAAGARHLPADFDQPGFERLAKMIFIRMQAANDAADLNDLRSFTTPELFAAIRLDLQDRGAQRQVTDVVEVNAEVLDLAEETDRQIVSVRYQGRIRETENGPVEPFDEIWHLVKPRQGDGPWAIAGIQQTASA
jgi:predicted lipid-binding transport protein (Tim44 family)